LKKIPKKYLILFEDLAEFFLDGEKIQIKVLEKPKQSFFFQKYCFCNRTVYGVITKITPHPDRSYVIEHNVALRRLSLLAG